MMIGMTDRMDGWVNGQIDRQIGRQIDRLIDRQMDRQIERQIDGQIDRQMDRQIDSQIDRQIGRGRFPVFETSATALCRTTGIYIYNYLYIYIYSYSYYLYIITYMLSNILTNSYTPLSCDHPNSAAMARCLPSGIPSGHLAWLCFQSDICRCQNQQFASCFFCE